MDYIIELETSATVYICSAIVILFKYRIDSCDDPVHYVYEQHSGKVDCFLIRGATGVIASTEALC